MLWLIKLALVPIAGAGQRRSSFFVGKLLFKHRGSCIVQSSAALGLSLFHAMMKAWAETRQFLYCGTAVVLEWGFSSGEAVELPACTCYDSILEPVHQKHVFLFFGDGGEI